MIKAIIFDFDNTLVNTYNAIKIAEEKSFRYWSRKTGIPAKKLHIQWIKFLQPLLSSRNPNKRFRNYSFPLFGKHMGLKYANNAHTIFRREIARNLKTLPSTIQTLKKLKKYRLAVFTETPRSYTILHSKKVKLHDKFSFFITSTETGIMKPSRKFYLLALKRLKLRPNQCMIVGDDPERDIVLAKKLGFHTVVLQNKSKYADYQIKSLRELPSILRKINR